MIKNRIKRIITVGISMLLIITMLSSCGLVNLLAHAILATNNAFYDFNDLEYKRPDFEKIKNSFVSLTDQLKKKKNSLSFMRSVSRTFEMYNDAYTQYMLVQLRFYGNIYDTKAEEEINYCAEQFALLDPIVNDFYITALDNGYQDTFFNGWPDAQIEYIRIQQNMFDDEYAKLVARRTEIENEYMGLLSSFTVDYQGVSYTIDEIKRLDLSEAEYNALASHYYNSLSDAVAVLYSEFVSINDTLAEKAGFDTYTEFSYRYIYQRDYQPEDVEDMYCYVKDVIVPLYFQVASLIDSSVLQSAMNAENATFEQYDTIFEQYTTSIASSMYEAYQDMKKYNLYNIGSSEGMQKAGLTTYLPSYSVPYLYLYTYGDLSDISSFIHEFGHFFSFYYNGDKSGNNIDVAEIQSQANEWLFMPFYDLTEEELEQYTLYRLSDTLLLIIQGCLLDEFQQKAYENTTTDYSVLFESIAREYCFEDIVPPELLANYWSLVHHNFVMPFYYISYAVSAFPSLEIYFISQSDRTSAISSYLSIVVESGYYDAFHAVLEDAGLNSPFDESAYKELSDAIQEYLSTVE